MEMEGHRRTLKKYVTTNGDCLFDDWFENIKDFRTQAIISTRLNRIIQGNFGDCKSIGRKVKELRIDYGSGYRVYFAEDGPVLVILLIGGDKRSQWKDIERAKKYWEEYCETKTS